MTRHRTRGEILTSITGSATNLISGSSTIHTGVSTSFEECDDIANSPGLDHPLSLKKTVTGLIIGNGSNGTILLENFPGYYRPIDHGLLPTLDLNRLATKGAARSNPGNPEVGLPVFIAELRDFPRLIQSAGDAIFTKLGKRASARHAGGQFLAYEFGLRPLVGDLSKLLSFSNHSEKKFQELKKLRQNGVSRRVRTVDTFVSDECLPRATVIGEQGIFCSSVIRKRTTRRVWTSTKWKPQPGVLPEDDADLRKKANAIAYGLTRGQAPQNLWNAMPWTWLADWFGSVGDYLQSRNNAVAYQSGRVNLMTHTFTQYLQTDFVCPTGYTLSEVASASYETKERIQLDPTPFTFELPILSKKQFAILASISAR